MRRNNNKKIIIMIIIIMFCYCQQMSCDVVIIITCIALRNMQRIATISRCTEVGPTALAWPMTLTFNLLQAMVMTYLQSCIQKFNVSSHLIPKTEWKLKKTALNRGRTDCISLVHDLDLDPLPWRSIPCDLCSWPTRMQVQQPVVSEKKENKGTERRTDGRRRLLYFPR